MTRRFMRRTRFPGWFSSVKDGLSQLIVPLFVFQVIRTIFFPTVADFFIILILVVLYLCFSKGIL